MRLDPTEVGAACEAWLYVPAGTEQVVTEEFRVLAYPSTWACPTVATRICSERSAQGLVDDLLIAVGSLGRSVVWVWVQLHPRPVGLVDHLLSRGAVLDERLAVLARPLDDLPDLDVPDDVVIRPASDLESLRVADQIDADVFGGSPSTDEQLLATHAGPGSVFVASRDGAAVGSGGLVLVDGVLRLWGGAVLPQARGTGVYRALLAHRLALGVRAGCSMALVKGRVETSAPILGRAGFEQYGEETSYRLAVT